jgi:homoserine acetyltransferase
MGGQQSYHMAALYPDFVEHIVCIAGSAKTSAHNWSFLEGPRHALIMSADFDGGNYMSKPLKGQRAFSRVYSTWALSQGWFRQRCWEQLGFKSLEEYLEAYWSGESADANGLLALLWTWQQGDIGLYYPDDDGDLSKTLKRIKAKVLAMPARTDMYFPPEDSEYEVQHLEKGELRVIETVWGHIAGGGNGAKEDTEFMKREIARFVGV